MNGRERLIRTLDGQATDFVPVLPKISYATTLAVAGGMPVRQYLNDAGSMSLAVTEAYRQFGFDGVSVHSDISSEGIALGSVYDEPMDQPRQLRKHCLDRVEDLDRIRIPDPRQADGQSVVIAAVEQTVRSVGQEAFIVAWTNAPLNVASQLLPVDELLVLMLDDSDALHALLEIALEAAIRYGTALVEAGADAIAYGHALASSSVISPSQYEAFALPYERRLCQALHEAGARAVITHICGNIEPIARQIATNGADVIDFDHMNPVSRLRQLVPSSRCLRGNIDPLLLQQGSPEAVFTQAAALIQEAGPDGRLILGSGCEIQKQTPRENLLALSAASRNTINHTWRLSR